MADNVRLLAMQRNLSNAEKVGDTDRAKRIKARINKIERAKAPKAEPKVETKSEPEKPQNTAKKES